MYGRVSDPGMVAFPVRRDLDIVPRGNFRRALALLCHADQYLTNGVGVPTLCGAGIDPGDHTVR